MSVSRRKLIFPVTASPACAGHGSIQGTCLHLLRVLGPCTERPVQALAGREVFDLSPRLIPPATGLLGRECGGTWRARGRHRADRDRDLLAIRQAGLTVKLDGPAVDDPLEGGGLVRHGSPLSGNRKAER